MKKLKLFLSFTLLALIICLTFTSCVTYSGSSKGDKDEEDTVGEVGTVDEGATEDVLYTVSEDSDYAVVAGYKGKSNHIVISKTFNGLPVKEIGNGAFAGKRTLISVTIPEGITSIGEKAFYGCEWLENVSVPEGVTSIGAWAFDGCKLMKTVSLPKSLAAIGVDAFNKCTKLEELYVADINSWCKTALGSDSSNPLYYASNLYVETKSSLVVELDEGISSISEYILNCENLKKITIPSSVTHIEKGAFSRATALESITLPFVGGSVYDNSYLGFLFGADSYASNSDYVPSSLKKVTVSGNATIGEGAFYNCRNIEHIIFNGSPTEVRANAFASCLSLKELYLPKSIISIAQGALAEASSVESITLPFVGGGILGTEFLGYIFGASDADEAGIYIPTTLSKVKILGGRTLYANAFSGCYYIKEIYLSSSTEMIENGALSGLHTLAKLTIPYVGQSADSPSYLGHIFGASTYTENRDRIPSSLKSVEVLGAQQLGEYAFYGCADVEEILLPLSLTSIGQNAFKGCTSLKVITVPYAVSSIGNNAFAGCSKVEIKCMLSSKPYNWSSTWNPDGRPVAWSQTYYGETEDGFLYSQTATSITIIGYNGAKTDIVIPSSIGGYSVISIGDSAFIDNTEITSLSVPSTVSSIGTNAFYGCTSLRTVTLAEGLQTLKDCAFYGCGFSEITIPASVRTIGISAISYCINLSKVVFSSENRLNTVSELAFRGDNAIDTVYLGDLASWCKISFGSEDANPLLYAKNIYANGINGKCIVIPNGVSSIGSYCFEGTAFNSIVIPDSVVQIKSFAFNGASHLTAIVIPSTVNSVGESAFFGCSRLTIYTKADEVPSGWSPYWNYSNRPVVYGCTATGISNGLVWVKANNAITIAGYCGSGTSVSIPQIISGSSVTAIANNAFRDADELMSVSIPSSLVNIGSYAFSGCTSLTSVYFSVCDGWFYSSSASAQSGTSIAQEELNNPATAAEILTVTNSKNYFKKK